MWHLTACKISVSLSFLNWIKTEMSQRTTKPTIRLMRPAKSQINLRICAVWSESSLIVHVCVFYSLQAISSRKHTYIIFTPLNPTFL